MVFARKNTIGKFSDIPLVLYAERLVEDGHPLLQYTMIFSNEDGGTSTRALMARWGRNGYKVFISRNFARTPLPPGSRLRGQKINPAEAGF